MKEYFLNIGEVKVAAEPSILTCFGLGSCIGLFLFDRTSKIGGGAHIMLPDGGTAADELHTLVADKAIKSLMALMTSTGANSNTLRAILVGGANVLSNSIYDIGRMNILVVRDILINRKIFIADEDTGGYHSRSVRFSTLDGSYRIFSSYKENEMKYGKECVNS